MQREKGTKIAFCGLLILSLVLSAVTFSIPISAEPGVTPWDFPRLDEFWFVAKYPDDVAVAAAKAGEIDNFIGAIDPADVEELSSPPYNWNVSMTEYGGFHMCYHGFNCRDTPPDTAGVYTWFYNRTTDFPLIPCNISSFRLALQYIIGIETKEAWIDDMYEYVNRPQMFYIPFANEYWINPYLDWYHKNWTHAADVLIENGFEWDYGPDTTPHTEDDKWTMPNGKVLYDGTGTSGGSGYSERYAGLDAAGDPFYGILVCPPGDGLAPPSHEISRRHVKEWNRFFMGKADQVGINDASNTALFIDDPDDTYGKIYFSPFYNRDHDIYMLCWGLSRNPDYLYDLFHPDYDYPGWGNSPGLVHDDLDDVLWSLKYWKMIDWEFAAYNTGGEAGVPTPVLEFEDCDTIGPPGPAVEDVKYVQCHKTGVHRYIMLEKPETMTFENGTVVDLADPVCSWWHETDPTPCRTWHIEKWFDCNEDGFLSPCDTVGIFRPPDQRILAHVDALTWEEPPGVFVMTLGGAYDLTGTNRVHMNTCLDLYIGDQIKINYASGTHERVITDIEEMRDLVWLAQDMMYYLNPYNPIYSRNYINLFGTHTPHRDTYLTNWVESEGYGSCPSTTILPWTYAGIHWEDQPVGGDINWHVAGHVESLNPILASWVYEVIIINRLYDSLYVINPETHEDMPWAACHWELIPWESVDPNVPNGMIIKIWLRNDVRWHDGQPVTAEDIKWNFDFIDSIEAPELTSIWIDYIKSEVVNDEVVEIYVNATGMWKAYDYLGSGLIFPKQIWTPFWGDYEGAIAFEGQDYTYEEWTGCPAPPDKPYLSAFIGTGPFWAPCAKLDEAGGLWDYEAEIGHAYKNRDYWVRAASGVEVCTHNKYGQLGQLRVKGQWGKELECPPMHLDIYPPDISGPEQPFTWPPATLEMPISTQWHDTYPECFCSKNYHLIDWIDTNEDMKLSPCDMILLEEKLPPHPTPGELFECHVENVTVTMLVAKKPYDPLDPLTVDNWKYLEYKGDIQEFNPEMPVCTQWHVQKSYGQERVYNQYCVEYHLADWLDENADGVLSYCDQIILVDKETGNWSEWHVEALKTDMIVTCIPGRTYEIPKITRLCDLEIEFINLQKHTNCTFEYKVLMDGEEIVPPTLVEDLPNFGNSSSEYPSVYRDQPELPWKDIPPCVHTFKLYCRKLYPEGWSAWSLQYKKHAAVTFGDVDGNCKVNIVDIFYTILYFGSERCYPLPNKWHVAIGELPNAEPADIDCNGKVNIVDIFYAILNFGKECTC